MDNKTEPTAAPTEVSLSTTSCRQCVFAEYDGNKQSGCSAGRLQVLHDNGVEIILNGDGTKEFFLIKDKACPYFRHKDKYKDIKKDIGSEKLTELVKYSLKIPYHVMLFMRSRDSLEDLESRLSELYNQDIPPSLVTVIDRTHGAYEKEETVEGKVTEVRYEREDLTPQIVGFFHKKYRFGSWRTQRVAAVDIMDPETVDLAYDNTKDKKYFFYTIFEASQKIPEEFSSEIHYAIQEKSEAFVVLESGHLQEHGHTVLKIAHAKYAGNSFGVDLRDKIIHYDDAPHLIRNLEELCPSIKKS